MKKVECPKCKSKNMMEVKYGEKRYYYQNGVCIKKKISFNETNNIAVENYVICLDCEYDSVFDK